MCRTAHLSLLFAVLLLGPAASGQTGAADGFFFAGNGHLAEKRYAEALSAYDSAALAGGQGFDLLYNSGVAAFRLGRLGMAAQYWERARRLRPSDGEVRHNLRVVYARAKDGLKDPEDRPFVRLRDLTSPDGWGIAALLFAFLGAGGMAAFVLLPRGRTRWISGAVGGSLLLVAVSCLWLARAQYARMAGKYVVVVAPRAVLLTAPDASATPLDTLREAAKLPLIDQLGGFYQVALPNGDEPWLEAAAVGVI
jgi:tetratricopeptide (TPR) repeat protein